MWAEPEKREILLRELASHDRVIDFEVLARRKSDETFYVLYSVSKLRTTTGEALLLGVIHDITERKQAEELVRHQNRMLLSSTTLRCMSGLNAPSTAIGKYPGRSAIPFEC